MRKLSESVWGDLRKKSLGQEDRIEDKIGNLKDLSPVDMGGSVLWADLDLEYDNKFHFKFSEVLELIKNSGWRLPTLAEVAELDKLQYHHDSESFWFTNNFESLYFKKRGMYHYTAGWLDRDRYYYAWTSDMYNNHQVHDFTMDNESMTHSPLNSRDSMKMVVQNTEDKLSVRLVKDKGMNESVWGDIRKKSLGQEERIEDNINVLDFNGLVDYITRNYEISNSGSVSTIYTGGHKSPIGISLTFMKFKDNPNDFNIDYMYDKNEEPCIFFAQSIVKDLKKSQIYPKLQEKFILYDDKHPKYNWIKVIGVKPQEGKVDNKFLLEFVDFISDIILSYINRL